MRIKEPQVNKRMNRNTDEECEQITEDGSDLDSITRIVEYYLEEGGTEENIC